MRIKPSFLFVLLFCLCLPVFAQDIESPSRKLSLSFRLTDAGEPTYSLSFAGKPVILQSKLGVQLKDAPALTTGFTVVESETSDKDETWRPVWGEVREIRNRYRELAVTLGQASPNNRRIVLRFRLFDDGLGFRYEFPEQDGLKYFIATDEKT
ncbi:MAG: glycoside hydrolase family 97 N-terminal domain-containing protein, partial [Acidobacteriota bacterium]|nr:glycoside hydrolase family 97 N-terminal domain-containing protein [Acidobacteriota bacterium]